MMQILIEMGGDKVGGAVGRWDERGAEDGVQGAPNYMGLHIVRWEGHEARWLSSRQVG